MKILVADDEPKIRRGLSNLIQQQNESYKVQVAGNGKEALTILDEFQPDVIYLDIKMPMMDGLTFAKKAKRDYPNLLIIIVSGYAQFDYAQEAMKVGAIDYILKPIMPDKIIETLKKAEELLEDISKEQERDNYYTKKRIQDLLIEKSKESLTQVTGLLGTYRILFGENMQAEQGYEYKLAKSEKEKIITQVKGVLGSNCHTLFFYKENLIGLLIDESKVVPSLIEVIEQVVPEYFRLIISPDLEMEQPFYQSFKEFKVKSKEMELHEIQKEDVEGVSNKIIYYIENNYSKKINLSDLADEVYMHATHVSKLFKKETGINISEYITAYRIEEAKKLLCHSKYKVYDVAYKVGFNSPKYFINVFKAKTGMTPSDFRNKNM